MLWGKYNKTGEEAKEGEETSRSLKEGFQEDCNKTETRWGEEHFNVGTASAK